MRFIVSFRVVNGQAPKLGWTVVMGSKMPDARQPKNTIHLPLVPA